MQLCVYLYDRSKDKIYGITVAHGVDRYDPAVEEDEMPEGADPNELLSPGTVI